MMRWWVKHARVFRLRANVKVIRLYFPSRFRRKISLGMCFACKSMRGLGPLGCVTPNIRQISRLTLEPHIRRERHFCDTSMSDRKAREEKNFQMRCVLSREKPICAKRRNTSHSQYHNFYYHFAFDLFSSKRIVRRRKTKHKFSILAERR